MLFRSYTLAVDRNNSELGKFFDPCHPAVLKMIEMTVRSAHNAGILVGLCGDLGTDTKMTECFLRMGIDELSATEDTILPLREKIISLDLTC